MGQIDLFSYPLQVLRHNHNGSLSFKSISWQYENFLLVRYQTGFVTEEERKYQMLLWWRRVHGWKATSQRLVILLELGNYTEDEYAVILTSSNGDVTIYDKAPDIQSETKEPNDKRELYHSDVTKSPGGSYGNETYGNTVQARVYEKNAQKGQTGKKKSRNKEQEVRFSPFERGDRDWRVG